MKSLIKIFFLVTLTAGLSSCESIKSIFDIEVDTEFVGELDIVVEDQAIKSTSAGIPFDSKATINMLENDDVHEHQDKIDAFVLNSLVASVVDITQMHPELGAVVIHEGTIFSISNDSEDALYVLSEDWTITDEIEVDLYALDEAKATTVESILTTIEPFDIAVDGTCNQAGVTIVIELKLGVTVTANPL